jgi:maleate isomerase
MQAKNVRRSSVSPKLLERPFGKRIGMIALATDHTSENDFRRLLPRRGAALYVNRVAYANPTTLENLRAMQPHLAAAAADILPGEPLEALCYSCTAATVAMGDAAVEAAVHEGKPGVPVVTPALAARVALKAFGAKRISVLTPYRPEPSAAMLGYFQDHGLEVLNLDCLGFEDDREMARIDPEDIVKAALEAISPEAEALFISCTALRAAEVASRIEDLTKRPVVSSNLASAWMCLGLAGVKTEESGGGSLLSLPLPASGAGAVRA